jgi:hypothetical protein
MAGNFAGYLLNFNKELFFTVKAILLTMKGAFQTTKTNIFIR